MKRSPSSFVAAKVILRIDKSAGVIVLDSETQLSGIPAAAWEYRLGNRSPIEWIVDQYKERTPRDPIVRQKFDTYRFSQHKEKVIDLMRRVAQVSVDTVDIVNAMKKEGRRD